ncbi:DUF167 domain-containing protein [Nitratireductor aquimarinus]|uniref:UPF0235 protein R2G56_06550 n=1 Tax=Nitratireductor aquimarinus TaxID=889300 RepID=A0ABU4AI69_9HYPH|nr:MULTISPECIES: DUF167 family protein [Nitratireductor]MBN8245093.1 DUF167 domain-containing protein [Nitratireductor aquimarinus]MBY6133293.1 DUF167 family protein [Nitratireductor aquimarinus]MCA1303598.1 DUF167 family protein [Nitratireductor aquimarinus]MCV0351054.1 DUF167 family protein [Nitratireductor sp.]MDJ1464325.1 DUF167 family protein [Nitratireductor sp. GZWM139]
MSELPAFCRQADDGLVLFVRLTPKSSRDAIEGPAETADGRCHLKARVRAVPENGKANAALEKLLAKQLRVPAGSVSVTGGSTSRLKTVTVANADKDVLDRLSGFAAEK